MFHWPELGRQVLIGGDVSRVSAEESDAYFASRPRESRLGAWASAQGTPLRDREQLLAQLEEVAARFPGEDVPRPEFWGGFRLAPRSIEFWESGEHRLHDRFVYVRNDGWRVDHHPPLALGGTSLLCCLCLCLCPAGLSAAIARAARAA